MKYILILFFVIGCESKPKNDDYKTYIVCGADTVIMDDYGNTDVSKAGSTHGYIDTVNRILYIEILKEDTLKDYPITIHGGDSLPYRFTPIGSFGFMPDSIWITDNPPLDDNVYDTSWVWKVPWPIAVKDGKEYIATYDSLGNIYFKEK